MSKVVTIERFNEERRINDEHKKILLKKAKFYKEESLKKEIQLESFKTHTINKLNEKNQVIDDLTNEIDNIKSKYKVADISKDQTFESLLNELAKPIAQDLKKRLKDQADEETLRFLDSF